MRHKPVFSVSLNVYIEKEIVHITCLLSILSVDGRPAPHQHSIYTRHKTLPTFFEDSFNITRLYEPANTHNGALNLDSPSPTATPKVSSIQ